ncbi:MAG: hypothetical protein JST84_04690 [Acidobacteria bacterium]|nr:hypothetical protein [Acidobacteriota bacterium]
MKDFDYDLGKEDLAVIAAQWHNGNSMFDEDAGFIFRGGVLIEKRGIAANLDSIPGFTEKTIKLNRNPVTSFISSEIQIAVVGRRLRYFAGRGEGRITYPQSAYEQATAEGRKLRGNLQVACYVKDFDVPIILSFTGTSSSDMVQQLKRLEKEALPVTTKNVGDNKQVTMPLRAFWLTLKPAPHSLRGSKQQSEATPPQLGLPQSFTREWLLERYVGSEPLTHFNKIVANPTFNQWLNAWQES